MTHQVCVIKATESNILFMDGTVSEKPMRQGVFKAQELLIITKPF